MGGGKEVGPLASHHLYQAQEWKEGFGFSFHLLCAVGYRRECPAMGPYAAILVEEPLDAKKRVSQVEILKPRMNE